MKQLIAILVLIVAQIIAALFFGYYVESLNMRDVIGEGVYFECMDTGESVAGSIPVRKVSLSGLRVDAAVDTVIGLYEEILADGQARIRYGADEFVFKYAEIDYSFDRESLAHDIEEKSNQAKSLNLFSSNWRGYAVQVIPDIKISDDAFKILLNQIKPVIERKPSNANIDIVDGCVSITPDASGVFFDVESYYPSIKDSFVRDPFGILYLSNRNGREIKLSPARISADILTDMETVIAEASTPIQPWCDRELMQKAAESINKVFLHSLEVEDNTQQADLFSFNKYLANRELLRNSVVEEYNQIAATLYIAILKAGIGNDRIFSYRQERKTDYCDLGFDISVLGSNRDFRFENTLSSDIIIFASVEDDMLTIRVAGRFDDDNAHTHVVSSKVIETFEPQTLYLDGDESESDDGGIADEGAPGYVVSILRDGYEIERLEYRSRPVLIYQNA